ncbi:MAG: glycosyltransferase family 2 protein, partial [Propionicimonas sp.]
DCELVIIDNGSTDDTQGLVSAAAAQDPRIRYVPEPQPGIGRARSAGLKAARGDILVFTDDDVLVPPTWIANLTLPIRDGTAAAVAGGIMIAEDLRRPWLTPGLAARYYAHSPEPPAEGPGLIGANMAVRREVARNFDFDDALGTPEYPGAEDVLFYVQVKEAGWPIRGVADALVEHHFDPARLALDRMEALAEGYGRCDAYFFHHWLHASFRWPLARIAVHRLLLLARLVAVRGDRRDERVLQLRREVAFHREMRTLRGVPRRYAYRGARVGL